MGQSPLQYVFTQPDYECVVPWFTGMKYDVKIITHRVPDPDSRHSYCHSYIIIPLDVDREIEKRGKGDP